MKTIYMQTDGDRVIKHSWQQFEGANAEKTLSDAQRQRLAGNVKNWKLDGNGAWQVMTSAEINSRDKAAALPGIIQQLKDSCRSYQKKNRVDSNMFAMLTSLKGLAVIQGIELAPKAAACLQWVDDLWADEDARETAAIAGEDVSFDFSSHNQAPYSFSEVRAEAGM